MVEACKVCGGQGEWREKSRQKFRTYDAKAKRWMEEWGEVWVDKRCNSCKGSGIK